MKDEFDVYVMLYSSQLTRLCVALCRNQDDAEDLFQETWCKALRHFDKYDTSQPFDKWLLAICINTYKNSVKHSFNSRQILFQCDEDKERFLSSIPCAQDEHRDDYIALHQAVHTLPKKQRIVIMLRYFDDYTIKDIAEIVGVSEGTVKSRLYNAKKTLRRRLGYESE